MFFFWERAEEGKKGPGHRENLPRLPKAESLSTTRAWMHSGLPPNMQIRKNSAERSVISRSVISGGEYFFAAFLRGAFLVSTARQEARELEIRFLRRWHPLRGFRGIGKIHAHTHTHTLSRTRAQTHTQHTIQYIIYIYIYIWRWGGGGTPGPVSHTRMRMSSRTHTVGHMRTSSLSSYFSRTSTGFGAAAAVGECY